MEKIIQITSIDAEGLQSLIKTSISEAFTCWQKENQVSNDIPEFGTRKEVAALLQISLPTVDDYINRGLIDAVRIGGRIRIRRSEIDKALIAIKSIRYKRK